MGLLVFLAIFLLINFALLRYCKSKQEPLEWVSSFTCKDRKIISSNELENMRKYVNNPKSKF